MKGKFSVIIYDGMPCICTTLKPDDDIGFLCHHVRNLPFSFVAPVGSYHCFNHFLPHFCTAFSLPPACGCSADADLDAHEKKQV